MWRVVLGLSLLAGLVLLSPVMAEPATLQTSGGNLTGTITLPTGVGPFPLVLIIAGSGPVDRDGNSKKGLDTDCYKQLADALARKGIASLRYDKRGVGESAAAVLDEGTLRLSTYVEDAVGWASLLRHDPRFSTVTIVGHSEGSLVGMLAAEKITVDGFVSIAGAGEPMQALILHQLEPLLPPDAYAHAKIIVASLERGVGVNDVPEVLEPVFRPSVQPYLISAFDYDPAHEIGKLKMPVLIAQGERDLQVPVKDARLLANGAPRSARLALIPDMNHVLKTVARPEDNLVSYQDPTKAIDPKLVDVLSEFVHQLRRGRCAKHSALQPGCSSAASPQRSATLPAMRPRSSIR